MDRKILIEALRNVDPARSVTQSAEVMKTFWFTGKRVMAFNGGLSLGVALETEWAGSIQSTLLPLLASSNAPECDFVSTEKGVTVKAGSSKFKLLSMDAEQFNFKFPKQPEDSLPIVDVPKFIMALKACKRSLGSETSEAMFKGITMMPSGKTLHLFSYDRMTFTHCRVKLRSELDWERVIVSTAVVDQIIRISEGATEMLLCIDAKKNTIYVKCGGVMLWAQLEDLDRNNKDFVELSRQYTIEAKSTIDASDKKFAKKFPGMLDRSVIISADAVESTKLRVTIEDNKINFYSKSTRGIVEEAVGVPDGQKHHAVTVRLPPARLLQGLELGSSLSFTPRAAIVSNHDQSISFLVSGD